MILFWLKSAYFTAPIPIILAVFKMKSSVSKRLSFFNLFNRFYDQVPILKVEIETKISRLTLCALTEKTLKLSLELLGIESLERM